MSLPARTPTNDLDRMADDGAPPGRDRSASVVQVASRRAAAAPGGSVAEWYRRLGAARRHREERAHRDKHAVDSRNHAREVACRRRWPAIVAEMRTLIRSYNDGTGAETVTLIDERAGGRHELTATVTGPNERKLVLEVDGADLWVRATQDQEGRPESERWIGLDRSDGATAHYVLQNWLAQL